MLATETRIYPKKVKNLCICDNLHNETLSSPALYCDIDDFSVPKPSGRPKVSKSYEVSGNTISENYFETSYCEDDIEFVNEFAQHYKNGIIMIMTENMSQDTINFFTSNMKSKLKYIIYYQGDVSQFAIKNTKGLTFIRTFSLKSAVIEAYKKSKSGQAIIFPQIDQNFDFFQYIDETN